MRLAPALPVALALAACTAQDATEADSPTTAEPAEPQ